MDTKAKNNGDDGAHGPEKYSRRRTTYTNWREKTAADLMPVKP